MATLGVPCGLVVLGSPAISVASASKRELFGSRLQAGRVAPSRRVSRSLTVEASRNRKVVAKEPFGPSGQFKFKKGVDASGSKQKGMGVYQFGKKYGANVDGYSPIYDSGEWASSGDVYAGGSTGLTLWAVTFGALLLFGALLVYNTSAISQ